MNNKKRLTISMTSAQQGWGWAYLLFYLVLFPPLLGMGFDALGWEHDTPAGNARLNGVFFLVNFLAAVMIFRSFLGKNLVRVGKRFWGFVQAVILGFVMYYAGIWVVGKLMNWLIPGFQNLNDQSLMEMARASKWVMVLGTVILAPVTEECFIRGLVFGSVMKKNRILAYVISTIFFAAIHVAGYVTAAPAGVLIGCFLQYLPAGVALGWAYEKADSIFAPILMHCIINALSVSSML